MADDHERDLTVREREVVVRQETKPERPPLYAVVLLNDDYTPREFVTEILKRHFGLDADTAYTIMMYAHQHGEARIGAWPKDVADTKIRNAEDEAREAGHPLQFRSYPLDP